MNRIPRASHPLLLAFFCWLMILLVPAARQSFWTAWTNRFVLLEEEARIDSLSYPTMNGDADELLQRFPNNKDVKLYAAVKDDAAKWLKSDPQNAVLISVALSQQVSNLKSNRETGPLTNPNYPLPPKIRTEQSSPIEWNSFIDLARRGQKLEPDNTYFDWMLLYGLYATRQDVIARQVLAKAARKTAYDDHQREVILNRLKVLHLVYGYPLSTRDLHSVYSLLVSTSSIKIRQTSRWIMESVISDRQQKKHSQALDKAFDLARLSRAMRREGHLLITSLIGTSCEMMAFSSVTPPVKNSLALRKARSSDPLSAFQSHPQMLYFYAKSQKRSDMTSFLDKEWVEIGKWRKLGDVIIDQPWTGNSNAQTMTLLAVGRFSLLVVKALPVVCVLLALFTLLSRRFSSENDASVTLWPVALRRGIWFGVVAWLMAMICDALIIWRAGDADEFHYDYMGNWGVLNSIPSWIQYGLVGAAICLGLNLAVTWQKEQVGRRLSLRSRFKSALETPDDRLVRYDFGWLLGLALHLTFWILLLGGISSFSLQLKEIESSFNGTFVVSLVLMVIALIVSLSLSLNAWRTLPRRRLTLRLSFRLIANTLSGFLVLTSVIYTFVAFASLPLAMRYERNFENAMQRGELEIAREKTGL